MAKRNPIKTARNKADKLWQIAVIKEYGETCEVCGQPTGPPHHFFPKGMANSLRYHIPNGVPLCPGCHTAHHLSGDPTINEQIIENRGRKWYNRLKLIKRDKEVKANLGWYREHIKRLSS